MSVLLYENSAPVQALNKVEGFNPKELARIIEKEGQDKQLYLDVKYRKLWFRLVHPAGKIIKHIVSFTEQMAVVEARVYLDKTDAPESYIANAFSQKFRSQDAQFGDKFLEMAETAAIGRALSDAGFGLQFADVAEEPDPEQVDAGITPPQNYPAQQQPLLNNLYQQSQQNMQQGIPQNMQQSQQTQQNIDQSMTVEELMNRMTYDQATQVVVGGTGKFANKTLGQIAIESPSSLNWFANSYGGNNHMIPAAAKIIMQQAMPIAG